MHQQFLYAALAQAKLGQGFCAPNPSVGAVAVQHGKIIAQAWHHGAGTPHAEKLLLEQVPVNTPGLIIYVTLEPCNHWGRTPPCVDVILQSGVEHVYYAYHDPNPIVRQGNTEAILREQGIGMTHVSLPEIDAFYESYAYWTQTQKPRVTVKMAQTLDGKVGKLNERVMLSNPLCHEFTHHKRAQSDVLLTTAATVLCDDPKMNVRLGEQQISKPVAIIDSQLRVAMDAALFATAKKCHLFHGEGFNAQDTLPKTSYHLVEKKSQGLDLEQIIACLGELGYHDVWVEAGPRLFHALHEQGLVHKTYIYLTPKLLGVQGINAFLDKNLFALQHELTWDIMGDNVVACVKW